MDDPNLIKMCDLSEKRGGRAIEDLILVTQ